MKETLKFTGTGAEPEHILKRHQSNYTQHCIIVIPHEAHTCRFVYTILAMRRSHSSSM